MNNRTEAKATKILRMRQRGLSFVQIGKALGITSEYASYLKRQAEMAEQEEANSSRNPEINRRVDLYAAQVEEAGRITFEPWHFDQELQHGMMHR